MLFRSNDSDMKTGITRPQFAPSPLNLWMQIPILEDRTSISYDPPISKKGDYICLKALKDVVIAFSACPQVCPSTAINNPADIFPKDILMTNGGVTTDAHFQIL